MTNQSDSPIFNIKVVMRETGITADVLRAWERRYGLPQPQRTEGGHRLYSRRDIDTIRWLISKQNEGLSISKAVDLWNQIVAAGDDPLYSGSALVSRRSRPEQGQSLEDIREGWIAACRLFDEQLADHMITDALALYPVEKICTEVLLGGLSQIGEEWYKGKLNVQQEHFASALAMRRLETLIAASPLPTRSARILAAAPPEEEHVFPLLLLTLFLRRRGWHVIYLGANVPLDQLESAVSVISPDLVVSAAQQLVTAANLLDMACTLQQVDVGLAFGGAIFQREPSLAARIPGRFLGGELENAPARIEQALALPLVPAEQQASREFHQALKTFRNILPIIEAHIWQELNAYLPCVYLETANRALSQDIQAALRLGDMKLLEGEIVWIERLLAHQGVPTEMLHTYLAAYSRAVRVSMSAEHDPVTAWFTNHNYG